MDDDKGLELSLGLPCGGSSSNSKEKSGNSAEVKADTDERTSKILNDFKNFLNAGISQPFQRVKSQENLFGSLSHTTSAGNLPGNEPVPGDKRKNMFDETSNQKRQETETRSSDVQNKGKTSRISITTDEGSTLDNEDVVDSVTKGSPSRVVSQCDDGSKTPVGSGSSSQVSKEVLEKVNIGGHHFPIQPVNNMSVPFSITIESPPSASTPSTSYKISNMMHATIPITNGERSRPHSASSGNMPLSFGYSPMQLPVLDKDSPWGMVARSQAHQSPFVGRAPSTSVPTQVSNPGSSEPIRLDGPEQSKGQTKQLVAEEGSSSHSEDDNKGRPNSFPSDYPSIRPGIAAEVKFGGSGSFPNLPWVSTTGPGPNGKTISGVTYKYNATQIKIVCACHGIHMSPDEFIQHASEDQPSASTSSGLASIPSSNPAASAKS